MGCHKKVIVYTCMILSSHHLSCCACALHRFIDCFSAAFIALRSIVLVDILGLEKLSNSFGILLLFQGLAGLVGSPIAGTYIKTLGLHMFSDLIVPKLFDN